jgi:hypothetical protein
VGRFWWPSIFDATLGFPGEGPAWGGHSPPDTDWMARASLVLGGQGTMPGQPWIVNGASDQAIHDVLLAIARRGNSLEPIAARTQPHPTRVTRRWAIQTLRPCRPRKVARTLSASARTSTGARALFGSGLFSWPQQSQRSIGS